MPGSYSTDLRERVLKAVEAGEAPESAIFAAYLEQVRLPALRNRKPDAVLVMDNLRAHKTPQVQAVLDGSGFAYRYLPAYSPDLNPIEPGRAKGQIRPAPSRRAHHRGPRTGGRSGSRQHHRSGCHRILQTLQLCSSELTRDLL